MAKTSDSWSKVQQRCLKRAREILDREGEISYADGDMVRNLVNVALSIERRGCPDWEPCDLGDVDG